MRTLGNLETFVSSQVSHRFLIASQFYHVNFPIRLSDFSHMCPICAFHAEVMQASMLANIRVHKVQMGECKQALGK